MHGHVCKCLRVHACVFLWWSLVHSLLGELDDLLEKASFLNGGSRVDVVAHSFGGMVVRSYISKDPGRAEEV